MDRNNKYYNLIEKLVKNHRKFPGYEAILEDIIDDVYAHSEVIISSIDNEDVIEAYLEKVISTSIIIVPKRLKFNTRVPHRVISSTPSSQRKADVLVLKNETDKNCEEAKTEQDAVPELSIDIPTEPIKELMQEAAQTKDNDIMSYTEQIVSEKANTKFVDQMINTMNSDLVVETDDIIPQLDKELDIESSEELFSDEADKEELSGEEEITAEERDVTTEILKSSELDIEPEEELISDDRVEQLEEVELFETNEAPILDIVTEADSDESVQAGISEESILDENEPEEIQEIESSSSNDNLVSDLYEEPEEITLDEEQLEDSLSLDADSDSDNEVELLEATDEFVISTDCFDAQDTEKLKESNEQSENNDAVMLDELSDDNSADSILLNEADDNLLLEDEVDNLNVSTEETHGESLGFSDNDVLEESEVLVPVSEDDIEFVLDEDVQSNNLDVVDEQIQEDIAAETISFDEVADEQVSLEDDYNEDEFLEPEYENNHENIEYKALDYNIFSYNPNEIKNIVDTKQISENLINLDTRRPDLNVLAIFELRYKQNNSLEQISEKLNMSKENIISALNEIVELV